MDELQGAWMNKMCKEMCSVVVLLTVDLRQMTSIIEVAGKRTEKFFGSRISGNGEGHDIDQFSRPVPIV
jgi:hypothetical protein